MPCWQSTSVPSISGAGARTVALGVTEQPKREGFSVGRNRVARLMRQEGIEAVPPKRFGKTTDCKHSRPVAPNLLDRQFDPAGRNEAWVTDIGLDPVWWTG